MWEDLSTIWYPSYFLSPFLLWRKEREKIEKCLYHNYRPPWRKKNIFSSFKAFQTFSFNISLQYWLFSLFFIILKALSEIFYFKMSIFRTFVWLPSYARWILLTDNSFMFHIHWKRRKWMYCLEIIPIEKKLKRIWLDRLHKTCELPFSLIIISENFELVGSF